MTYMFRQHLQCRLWTQTVNRILLKQCTVPEPTSLFDWLDRKYLESEEKKNGIVERVPAFQNCGPGSNWIGVRRVFLWVLSKQKPNIFRLQFDPESGRRASNCHCEGQLLKYKLWSSWGRPVADRKVILMLTPSFTGAFSLQLLQFQKTM